MYGIAKMNEALKKQLGRPRKYALGRRPSLTFRVTEPIHEKLTRAAAVSGRSISEEIERRVERSFESEFLDRLECAIAALEWCAFERPQFVEKWRSADER